MNHRKIFAAAIIWNEIRCFWYLCILTGIWVYFIMLNYNFNMAIWNVNLNINLSLVFSSLWFIVYNVFLSLCYLYIICSSQCSILIYKIQNIFWTFSKNILWKGNFCWSLVKYSDILLYYIILCYIIYHSILLYIKERRLLTGDLAIMVGMA